ncbi:MAG: hypothetical protein RL226_870 [Bacteroidota bacterium]
MRALLLVLLLCGWRAAAQEVPEYDMDNLVVADCDGILYDSGGSGDSYSINENLTFVIDNGGASIALTFFEEICIEDGFDFLYIYDGPSSASPLLAEITGAGFIPPGVVSTGGAITLVFDSDQSASYCGFAIQWETTVAPPIPPTVEVSQLPVCGSNEIELNFSTPIGCNWLYPDSVTVFADGDVPISNAAVDCVNGSGNSAIVTLQNPISYNCSYAINLVLGIPDACDSIWLFDLATQFLLNTCPVNAEAYAVSNELCQGECTQIWAEAEGCFEYDFVWNNGLIGPGPHSVCPTVTTTYTVTVTESTTGLTATASTTIAISAIDILNEDGPLCQSDDPFVLEATPSGGVWTGPGVMDQESGYFVPDSLTGGINVVTYSLENGCTAELVYDVTAIQSGDFAAACPGLAPFDLMGVPNTGVWSGPFVTGNQFDPSTEGEYTLLYVIDGCTDTLLMSVGNIGGPFVADTLCQSNWPDTLTFSPFGGQWSGSGIVDDLYGVFDPSEVAGGTYELLYSAIGCDQLFQITVKPIDIGPRTISSCPAQDPFIPYPGFTPTGGYWEGDGILNTTSGLYGPGTLPNDYWTGLIYYAPNGCTDTTFVYNRTTEIPIEEVQLCADEEGGYLNEDTVGNTPFGGSWSGPGVIDTGDDGYYFEPDVAGVGNHWVVYTANGCADSILVIIHPDALSVDFEAMCSTAVPFIIDASLVTPSQWTGPGIADPITGLFDPALAGEGYHTIFWTTEAGCTDTVYFEVEQFYQATITGLEEGYCFENIEFPLELYPTDAVLSGSTGVDSFNPAAAGQGLSVLTLTWSGDYCSSSAVDSTFVLPALEVDLGAADPLICLGSGTVLTASGGGGQPEALLAWTWSDGLFPVSTNTVSPEAGQYYYVTVNDGCSDPVTDSVFVDVLPPIQPEVSTSSIDCYGFDAYASASISPPSQYSINWDGQTFASGDQVSAFAGEVLPLQIIDLAEGCTFDTLVLVPSYPPLTVFFSSSPNMECIPFAEQPIQFLDFSQNAVSGIWEFGNGSIELYELGVSPQTSYDQPGTYQVSLIAENIGGCRDSLVLDICILDPVQLFVPDAFSPNGDGNNDVLFLRGRGLDDVTFEVYDRWGERVFRSSDPSFGWDGTYRGTDMPGGTYGWFARARVSSGEFIELTGDVVLMR